MLAVVLISLPNLSSDFLANKSLLSIALAIGKPIVNLLKSSQDVARLGSRLYLSNGKASK